jgi:hypothetical protein
MLRATASNVPFTSQKADGRSVATRACRTAALAGSTHTDRLTTALWPGGVAGDIAGWVDIAYCRGAFAGDWRPLAICLAGDGRVGGIGCEVC